MSSVHAFIGFWVVGVFTVGWVWGGFALVFRREPGPRFWTWLVVAQVIAGIQAVIGTVLLLLGRWPSTWRHLVYGYGPLVILLIAHGMSRELQRQRERGADTKLSPWMLFTAAAFICFGLSFMALATGLRIL
jgi:hypothetical protein